MAKKINKQKFIICDTGVMSRFLDGKPEFLIAMQDIFDNGNTPILTPNQTTIHF